MRTDYPPTHTHTHRHKMIAALLVVVLAVCAFARETQRDGAAQLQALLVDDTTHYIGTLSAVAPNATHAVAGAEYYAACFGAEHAGDLLMLALPVSSVWRTVLDEPVTASLHVTSSADPAVVDLRHSVRQASGRDAWDPSRPAWRRGLASKGRATMYGRVHSIDASDEQIQCFVEHHPDAAAWVPGAAESPHRAVWARYSPETIHWIGGFGDEHYIGAIERETYIDAWQPAERARFVVQS